MERRFGAGQWNRWVRTARAWFPERQIILRTDGRIRYLKISKGLQIVCCALVLAAIGWGGFTSITYFAIDDILRGKDEQISSAHRNYRTLLNEVAEYQARFSLLTKELQKNHAMMLDLVETNATLQLDLQTTQNKLDTTRKQQSEVVSAKSALREQLTSIEGEMQILNSKNFELRGSLSTVAKDLQNAVSERNKALDTNAKLKTQVAQLEQEIGRLHATETEVIQRMHKRTEEGIAFMERVFARAGLKTGEFLREVASSARDATPVVAREDEIEPEDDSEQAEAQTSDSTDAQADDADIGAAASAPAAEMAITRAAPGQGGPFVATSAASPPGAAARLKAGLTSLEERLGRWEDLRQLLRSAPLPAPLDNYQVSSTFGKRRDPFNNRWAMHYGVDMRAPLSTAVYATAPGTVSFAGSEGNFGRLIEIDHGMGFKTRYAHLNKILVRVGQKVTVREKIGLVGNSGRSTGAHVHYEISHNGRPVDPMRFIKAGKYVYKG